MNQCTMAGSGRERKEQGDRNPKGIELETNLKGHMNFQLGDRSDGNVVYMLGGKGWGREQISILGVEF